MRIGYTISGDGTRGFTVDFTSVWPAYSVCPCCDKPFLTLRKAHLFAENMRLIGGDITIEPPAVVRRIDISEVVA